ILTRCLSAQLLVPPPVPLQNIKPYTRMHSLLDAPNQHALTSLARGRVARSPRDSRSTPRRWSAPPKASRSPRGPIVLVPPATRSRLRLPSLHWEPASKQFARSARRRILSARESRRAWPQSRP